MMLAYFPTPFPDELLYSVLARMGQHLHLLDQNAVARMVFEKDYQAVVDLPGHIDDLVAALPFDTLTAQQILDHHTLLPYYALGKSAESYQQIVHHLRTAVELHAHRIVGISSSSIPTPPYLRYCSVCVQSDREHYAEAYWHRLHQVPGVLCCPTHKIWLHESNVRYKNQRKRLAYVALENCTIQEEAEALDLENREQIIILEIAKSVEWLLTHPETVLSKDDLHQRYLVWLSQQGYVMGKQMIDHLRLLDDFYRVIPEEALKRLDCELNTGLEKPWLARLVRPKKQKHLHPLYHLLFMCFMGATVDDVLQIPRLDELFGEPLWYCFNPVCPHYYQPSIHEFMPVLGKRDYIEAHFQCVHCGFKYAQRTPPLHHKVNKSYQRIIDYGDLWREKLLELWDDPTVTQAAASRVLGVAPQTVQNSVQRIRSPKSPLFDTKDRLNQVRRHKQLLIEQQDGRFIDWERRDVELAERIQRVAEDVLASDDKPIWMTETMLLKLVHATNVNRHRRLHPDRYPKTSEILEQYIESNAEWCVRRIWWWVRYALLHEMHLSPTLLLTKSGARYTLDDLRVKQALKDSYQWYQDQCAIGRQTV